MLCECSITGTAVNQVMNIHLLSIQYIVTARHCQNFHIIYDEDKIFVYNEE
jgi:hypothetical protein